MPIVKIRERGQLTIPAEFRKKLGLEENDAVNMIKVGDSLLITQKRLVGDALSEKMEKAMKKEGLTLDDLLSDLHKQRKQYSKEAYGQ
ncbi:MAG: AbrB/MazE/SpoVT family DNA-binding domain-containing protein [Thermodesulfovibrionia bacterium]|nr:AbrB/MazE/SpoVT family DNA-binding domain-containing protein [Thermodesulfovibrionia bacterium]